MQRKIGFSTGALAFGDFQRGVELQLNEGVDAIELSALREHELDGAIEALPLLDNSQFKYRSFHAPSLLDSMSDAELVRKLQPVFERKIPVVLHPDVINDFEPWKSVDELLLLENMDRRKPTGRTASEMIPFFKELPGAKLCFDIGHARQIDSSMGIGLQILLRFRNRLGEVHISEVNWDCKHIAISTSAAIGFRKLASKIPFETPIIIESVVEENEINSEMQMVRKCLSSTESLFGQSQSKAIVN